MTKIDPNKPIENVGAADTLPEPDGSQPLEKTAARAVRYCMITPTRDEEKFIAAAIDAVAAQTVRPAEWIIVNDGSTDRTGEIIDRYAGKYPWIRTLHRADRGFRTTGGGIEAFLDGYGTLKCKDWQFLVNLDGDLTFAPDYFEKCFEYFQKDPRLGIGGGTIYNKIDESLVVEKCPLFHVRGATKIYRRECWDAMGGMLRGLGWDTVDEIKASMRGWTTRSFSDLALVHYRITGTGWGTWQGPVKDGEADYIVGYHPLFFAVKCLRGAFRPPYFVRALGMMCGFVRSYLKRAPRVQDAELIRYLRKQQLRRLFGMETIWK
ncbi:MAG: glycosyltransferase family 2 protein [Blastocatellia bacterium]